MIAKVEVLRHLDNMMLLIWVPLAQVIKNLDFDEGLMVKPLLVPNNLNCDRRSRSMISAAQHLTKRPLPQTVHDFVTVGKMVTIDHEIVAALVVVAEVVRRPVWVREFLFATGPDVVHRWVVKNFLALVFRQVLTLATLKDGCRALG